MTSQSFKIYWHEAVIYTLHSSISYRVIEAVDLIYDQEILIIEGGHSYYNRELFGCIGLWTVEPLNKLECTIKFYDTSFASWSHFLCNLPVCGLTGKLHRKMTPTRKTSVITHSLLSNMCWSLIGLKSGNRTTWRHPRNFQPTRNAATVEMDGHQYWFFYWWCSGWAGHYWLAGVDASPAINYRTLQ